jgi:cystathionine gamma-lyase
MSSREAGTRYGDGTTAVHAGYPAAERGAPLLPGPTFAAPYHLSGPGESALSYGRSGNPTWGRYEAALGELEGGAVVAFASGMAAVTAVLLSAARPGQPIVLPADGYYATRVFARTHLTGLGVPVRELPTARPLSDRDAAGAALVLLETPSNPGLDVCDVAGAAEVAHRHGAALAVDNTTATPLGQRPLDLGADYSLASDAKAVTGHSDLVLGHVAVRDPDREAALREWRTNAGAVPGPFEAWLAHRSLGTLDLRLARQAANALALAELLRDHPAVTGLRYPGLPGDPGHRLAARQMRRFGGVLSFTLPSEAAVAAFFGGSRLVTAATSFGGLHTTADRRAQWGGDAVAAGFVRLSAGCEDTADLVADVAAALAPLTRRS